MSMKNDIIKEINKKENMLKKYISYHQYNIKEGLKQRLKIPLKSIQIDNLKGM